MADIFNTTSPAPSEGAKLSPIGSAFSGFLGTTWPLIRAERDLAGFNGMAWDPAVDAWIRDAEAAHDGTLAALKDVIAQPVMEEGDSLLRIVARIWDRVMQSSDPAEVADLYHFIVAKQNLLRTARRDAVGNALNRLLEGGLLRLQTYISIISRHGPDEDWAVVADTDISPDEPTATKVHAGGRPGACELTSLLME
jgi:hypothetical protein